MMKIAVRIGQVYRSKKSNCQVEIIGKAKSDRWKARILSNKPGVYKGTHSLAIFTIYKNYDLIS